VDDFIRPIRSIQQAEWALGRSTDRTYLNSSFFLRGSGVPARYVVRVFDEPADEAEPSDTSGFEWTEEVVQRPQGSRKQIQLLIARQGDHVNVHELVIEEVRTSGGEPRVEKLLRAHDWITDGVME
jgi:hypothetical protein